MRRMPSSSFRRQRGVALIMAVLIVALAVILATQIGFDSVLEQRRSTTVLSIDQAFEVGLGAEAWAASFLQQDIKDDNDRGKRVDQPSENWATPIPPIPVDGGSMEGQLEDMQGRFNLNQVVKFEGGQLIKDPLGYARFKKLLELLQMEPKWADILVDWIDSNPTPEFPEGAEDNVYTLLNPPYRTANSPMVSISELLALPEFGIERYRKIRPYVTALPLNTTLNVCTASGVVLDSYLPGQEYSLQTPEQLARARAENNQGNCFPQLNTFVELATRGLQDPAKSEIQNALSENTDYFRATIVVTLGTTEFTLYSLLHRESSGLVHPVMRSFGTD